MTICREWAVYKTAPAERRAKLLHCRSWSCEVCRPSRRNNLMRRVAEGLPQRLVTLTVNPAYYRDENARLDALAHAWRLIVKRLRRLHPGVEIEYVAIVEATERGEPHLHILARCPYVRQAVLSEWMEELTHARVVDIRRVHGTQQAVRYVAKYVGKAPHHFGLKKRYWFSQHYNAKDDPADSADDPNSGRYSLFRGSIEQLAAMFLLDGFAGRREDDGTFVFRPYDQSRRLGPWKEP